MGKWRQERCGKKKRKTIFHERTREGHHQSNKHWNTFKGNVWKLLRDRVERIWAFPSAQIPSWSELDWASWTLIVTVVCRQPCFPLWQNHGYKLYVKSREHFKTNSLTEQHSFYLTHLLDEACFEDTSCRNEPACKGCLTMMHNCTQNGFVLVVIVFPSWTLWVGQCI